MALVMDGGAVCCCCSRRRSAKRIRVENVQFQPQDCVTVAVSFVADHLSCVQL